MKLFSKIKLEKPALFGTYLAIFGVLVLTPDTMVMRFSLLDRWPLMAWRGFLMGLTLLLLWWVLISNKPLKEFKTLISIPGLVVIFAFSINSITFTLGIQETSVMVVLTALATMPVFAAVLSSFLMHEKQGLIGWITIIAAMSGVAIVVLDGNNASGGPINGSTILGAIYGGITALGLALTFTLARKFPNLGVVPAAAVGSLISGVVGLLMSTPDTLFVAPLWTILTMGVIILPISFACLSIAPRYTSSAIVSLIMLLELVVGPFWVWVGIGERPTFLMFLGAIFVLFVISFHIIRTQLYKK